MINIKTGFINPQIEQGPIASSYMRSIQSDLGFSDPGDSASKHYAILNYLYNISIGTFNPPVNGNANSSGDLGYGELASIGQLIGYPWPSAYEVDFSTNNFQFIQESTFPGTDPFTGFSNATTGAVNGTLTSATPSQSGVFIPVYLYQEILKFIAYIKWNGLSIISIDYLISGILVYFGRDINDSYTISYGANNDIYVVLDFTKANIGAGYLYVIQLLFDRVCTVPQVLLSIS